MKELYVSMVGVGGIPIECISQDWAHGMNRVGLLGFINMPHFGWLNEVNLYVKQLLDSFHNEILWLEKLVTMTLSLISNITGLPKDWPYPS